MHWAAVGKYRKSARAQKSQHNTFKNIWRLGNSNLSCRTGGLVRFSPFTHNFSCLCTADDQFRLISYFQASNCFPLISLIIVNKLNRHTGMGNPWQWTLTHLSLLSEFSKSCIAAPSLDFFLSIPSAFKCSQETKISQNWVLVVHKANPKLNTLKMKSETGNSPVYFTGVMCSRA